MGEMGKTPLTRWQDSCRLCAPLLCATGVQPQFVETSIRHPQLQMHQIYKTVKALACALILCGSGAAAQTSVDIPVEEARVIATRALFAGETELALQIARSLLAIDPDDRAALLVVAAGAPRVGEAAEGRQAGARAHALSQNDAQRYEAARLTALAASNEERFTLATFWLRRALTVAPNEEERARTLRDAGALRRANPWSTTFGFSIVPSNNVNGGADENEVDDLGNLSGNLSADALALEGVRATLNFGTKYRFYQSERDRATVGVYYQGARVRLRDETAEDPRTGDPVELDSDDYSSDYMQVSLNYDRVLQNGILGVGIAAGSFDYGGDPYYDFRRLSLSRTIPLSDPLLLFGSVRREWQDFDNENIGETMRTNVRAGLSYQFEGGDRLSGTIGHVLSDGDISNQTYEEWSFELGYSFAEPIGPVSLSLNAGIKKSDYEFYPLSADGRQDEGYFYGINLGLPGVEYAGFTPAMTITGSDTESNVGRFTRSNLSVGFTINSAF